MHEAAAGVTSARDSGGDFAPLAAKPRAFGLWAGESLQGSFAQFNAPNTQVELPNDRINPSHSRPKRKVPTGNVDDSEQELDHGALVPLWFLAQAGGPDPPWL